MKKAVSVLAIFLSLNFANTLYAATYYVSNSGNDNNSGTTINSPWKTISKANSILQPGDTINLRSGQYNEAIQPANSGQPGKYITYKSYGGEVARIVGGSIQANLTDKNYIVKRRKFMD